MITWFPKGAKSLHSQQFTKAYLALNPNLPLIAGGGGTSVSLALSPCTQRKAPALAGRSGRSSLERIQC